MNWTELFELWRTAKGKVAAAQEEERMLRQKLIEAAPALDSTKEGSTYQRLPDGRTLAARAEYSYRFRTSAMDTYTLLQKLPDRCKQAVSIKYEIRKGVFKQLSKEDQALFGTAVQRKAMKPQLVIEAAAETAQPQQPAVSG